MRTVVTWVILLAAIPCFGYAVLAAFTPLDGGLPALVFGVVLGVWGGYRDWVDHRHPMTRAQRARGYFWGSNDSR